MLLQSVLTDAEAKTANARLSSHSCSWFSNVFAFANSCASLAVETTISSKATSFWLLIDSFNLACSSSSSSSSSYTFVYTNINNKATHIECNRTRTNWSNNSNGIKITLTYTYVYTVNHNQLVFFKTYREIKHSNPNPKVRFYGKKSINPRDLCLLFFIVIHLSITLTWIKPW